MESLELKKISLNEIEHFSQNSFTVFTDIPISLKRTRSYIHNPRENQTKPVVYIILENNQIIAYISTLNDSFFLEGKEYSTIWLSSVWVHADHRRKGIANKLFDEIHKDYSGNIFATNAGHGSHQLLKKSNNYTDFKFIEGHRFYFRLSLSTILPSKSIFFYKIKPLLSIVDSTGNIFIDLKSFFLKKKKPSFIQPAEFNEELQSFISTHNMNSLFQRNIKEFQWIIDHPWVTEKDEDDEIDKKYYFTTSLKRFYQKAWIIKSNNEITGFIFYNVKNEEMSIHYIFYRSDQELKEFSSFILNKIKLEKISYLTLGDEKLIKMIKKERGFIFSKIWKKDFFVGKNLLEKYPEILSKDIYIGDGDSIFT